MTLSWCRLKSTVSLDNTRRLRWFSSLRYVSIYAERSPRGGAEFGGFSVFMCVSTVAVRRRVSAADPQEWVLKPFFRSALRRQLASNLLKYRGRDIDIRIRRSHWNLAGESAVVLPIRLWKGLEILKYQFPGFGISRNVRKRHLASQLNRVSTGKVVMLM